MVQLNSGNSKVTVPGSVTVPAGGSWADFPVTVNGTVTSPQTGQINATYAGTTRSAPFTVRLISVHHINIFGSEVRGGHPFSGQAVLECSNSTVPIAVTLSTDLPSVAFISNPSSGSLVIPAGQLTSSTITVETNPVAIPTFVQVRGTANGRSGTGSIGVIP